MCISVPDSLGHINSDFIGADASVSVSSQMRRDAMTALATTQERWLLWKMEKIVQAEEIRLCVCVCVVLFFFFHLQITELQCDKLKIPHFLPKATLIALICSDNCTTGKEKTREWECAVVWVCLSVCLLQNCSCHFSAMIKLATRVLSGYNQSLLSLPCQPISPKPYFPHLRTKCFLIVCHTCL